MQELKYKLFKRKARLLSHMKQHIEARDAFRQALKWLDWAKMEREKRIEHQTEIQKWLKMYETGKVVKNWGESAWRERLAIRCEVKASGSHGPYFKTFCCWSFCQGFHGSFGHFK